MTAARRTRSTLAGASLGLILVAAVSLFVSGCAPSLDMRPPIPTAATPTQAAPIFASDEEALAAAIKAYEKYLAMVDLILSEGGANPERLADVAIGDALISGKADIEEYASFHYTSVGTTAIDSTVLQSTEIGSDFAEVNVYLCEDVEDVDVLNREGKSMVKADRNSRTPFQARLAQSSRSVNMLLSQRLLWAGTSFC